MERWERREAKQASKKRRMRVTGRGLITVINQLEKKRADQRKAKDKS
jgi:hypothetical protein